MNNIQMKGVSQGKGPEGSSAQHRAHSPNNDPSEDGNPGDRVSHIDESTVVTFRELNCLH